MPAIERQLEELQREIEKLLESDRLDWLQLADNPSSRDEREELRQAIAQRHLELARLLDERRSIIQSRNR